MPISKSGQKRNVILMLADQMRADSLRCYGNEIVETPHLDRLAREGVRFDSAFGQHPQCVPSRACALTGRYAHINGAISNFAAMGPHEGTLPEHLQTEGYQTIGVGKLHIYLSTFTCPPGLCVLPHGGRTHEHHALTSRAFLWLRLYDKFVFVAGYSGKFNVVIFGRRIPALPIRLECSFAVCATYKRNVVAVLEQMYGNILTYPSISLDAGGFL